MTRGVTKTPGEILAGIDNADGGVLTRDLAALSANGGGVLRVTGALGILAAGPDGQKRLRLLLELRRRFANVDWSVA